MARTIATAADWLGHRAVSAARRRPRCCNFFQENLAQAVEQGASFSLIAVVGLIWSGLGLFSNITTSLDFIFHVPSNRSLWRQRLTAVIMALVLVVLIATSFMTSAVLRLVSALLLERPSLWINIGSIFLPLGLDMVIFALLFRYVPARRVHWDAVWPAAIFGAVGWELAKTAFGWYLLNVANYQFIYGTLSTAYCAAVLGIRDRLDLPAERRILRAVERMAAGSSLAAGNRAVSGGQSHTAPPQSRVMWSKLSR